MSESEELTGNPTDSICSGWGFFFTPLSLLGSLGGAGVSLGEGRVWEHLGVLSPLQTELPVMLPKYALDKH